MSDWNEPTDLSDIVNSIDELEGCKYCKDANSLSPDDRLFLACLAMTIVAPSKTCTEIKKSAHMILELFDRNVNEHSN